MIQTMVISAESNSVTGSPLHCRKPANGTSKSPWTEDRSVRRLAAQEERGRQSPRR